MNTTPVRPVQRSDAAGSPGTSSPSASAGPGANRRAADGERESGLHPSTPAASQEAFEQALQRVTDGRLPAAKPRSSRVSSGLGDADADEHDAANEASVSALPNSPSTPLPQAVPTPSLQPAAAPAPVWSTRAPQPLDAVSKQLNALQLPPASGLRSEWQLQLLDRSLPVQQLDIQRGAAGALRVVLSASPETARGAPLERLRQRLMARGSAPESLVFRQSREELDS